MKRVIYSILILITLLFLASCSSEKETKYQEGIELIQQEKWNEAALKLILLHDENYKDSKVLYNYVSAKEETEKQNYSQAGYMAKKIPDSYNGIMKEQILAFKKECIAKAEKLTPEQIEQEQQRMLQEANEALRKEGAFKLELISFNIHRSSQIHVEAVGQVKNISNTKMENIVAVVSYYDNDDNFITSDDALIDFNPILPNQTSPFKVITTYNPAISKAKVEFKYLTGGTILTDKK